MDPKAKYLWIASQHAAGRTVYVHAAWRVTKITPKNAGAVRLSPSGRYVEIRAGKRWDSINWNALTAQ